MIDFLAFSGGFCQSGTRTVCSMEKKVLQVYILDSSWINLY